MRDQIEVSSLVKFRKQTITVRPAKNSNVDLCEQKMLNLNCSSLLHLAITFSYIRFLVMKKTLLHFYKSSSMEIVDNNNKVKYVTCNEMHYTYTLRCNEIATILYPFLDFLAWIIIFLRLFLIKLWKQDHFWIQKIQFHFKVSKFGQKIK
jgi:hypothetical protein